jgi:putative heme-binding domain-containing protein
MRLPSFLLLLPLVAALDAQDHGNGIINPYKTPQDLDAGSKIFRAACAACHGLEGGGGANGPSLTTGTFKHGGTDEALHRTITSGVPGTPMSAFPLKDQEVWQLVAHIQDLNLRKGAFQANGDRAHGARIFEEKGCMKCHTAGGPGGFLGPDLSQIGLRRSVDQLHNAVVDPNREVAPEFWTLRARTKSGQTVTGIRLNEDMDSFQIREPSGRLRSLWKSELASYEFVRTSPMPSFKDKLQGSELEDLVAFLASLKGVQQ